MFERVERFVRDVAAVNDEGALTAALDAITGELGFRYYALTHHVDPRGRGLALRLHNYPDGWERFFDERGLATIDPVHRASHQTSIGFAWSDLDQLIRLTEADLEVLALARSVGIGEGFTIPAHVPGDAHGSCSFAMATGDAIRADHLALAQLVGAFAFEAARRMWRQHNFPLPAARMTDRQRECLMWCARGKSDWEIARILGISHETVIRHLKQARERYGVTKRTQLAIHALFDGTIAFIDVFRR